MRFATMFPQWHLSSHGCAIIPMHLSNRFLRQSMRDLQLSLHTISLYVFHGDPCSLNTSIFTLSGVNGGVCRSTTTGGVVCTCPPGFTGLRWYVKQSGLNMIDVSFVMLVKSRRCRVTPIHVSSIRMIIFFSNNALFADRFEQWCLSLRSSDDDVHLSMLWTCHWKVSIPNLSFAMERSMIAVFRLDSVKFS